MELGILVRIIKSHQFAKFEQNQLNNIGCKSEKLELKNSKMTEAGYYFKYLKRQQCMRLQNSLTASTAKNIDGVSVNSSINFVKQ